MNGSDRIVVYDTTLRDGSQTEGITFSCEDKAEILSRLEAVGVDFIEGGWPGTNPTDDRFFASSKDHPRLVAFGSTCRAGASPEEDQNLLSLAACGTEWCCIFGKAWDFQVTEALMTTPEENLRLIEQSVSFLRSRGKRVMFDAEHFFDGYYDNRGYALRAIEAAQSGGAEWIVLCDTNGGSIPSEITEAVEDAILTVSVPLGIHCHNDSDLATANTLAAVEAGCRMVQLSVNGLGERTGNANLCTVAPDLMIKMGMSTGVDLQQLTSLSRFVGEVSNMMPSDRMPYVGISAFSHKGGVHASAISRDSRTYEHIDPSEVGNSRHILVSDMAGNASVADKIRGLGMEVGDDGKEIVGIVKELESRGYQFDGADASFELLVRRHRGEFKPMFGVPEFRVLMASSGVLEASIKVSDRNGKIVHTAADGNGPVNALDNALRKALISFFPELDDVRLTDYKVRVLDESSATAAGVRVLIRSSSGTMSWTTVGVSENVVEASLDALVDSFEYYLMKVHRDREVRTMKRVIVTLVGKDHVGIIATVCNYFADNGINILDIKQTTIQEFINMMMIVDISGFEGNFESLTEGLNAVGEKVGCIIKAQHEEIFEMMYRI